MAELIATLTRLHREATAKYEALFWKPGDLTYDERSDRDFWYGQSLAYSQALALLAQMQPQD